MRTFLFSVCLATISVVGCRMPIVASNVSSSPLSETPTPVFRPGERVEIEMKSNSSDTSVLYDGVIKTVDDDAIVLSQATRTTRHDPKPGSLPLLPFAGRSGRNTGVAQEILPNDATIRLSEILTARPTRPAVESPSD